MSVFGKTAILMFAMAAFLLVRFPEQVIATGTPKTVSTSPSATASRTLYIKNCARCHGSDGKSDTETGRLYDSPDISGGRLKKRSTRALTRLITNGKGSMPAFSKKLTRSEIAALVAYVRGL